MPKLTYETNDRPAYELAMDYVNNGMPVALVPVRKPDGTHILWTSVIPIVEWVPKDDVDALAGAMIAIKQARDLAARNGFLVD